MERILTVEQMRKADDFAINHLGISSDVLIERAGYAVAEEVIKRFKGGRVLVCIGKGNNGKDGEVVAKILSKVHGFKVSTVNVYNGIFKVFDNKFDIIIDCIFGTGLNKKVEGAYLEAINLINEANAYVVSCDIPSGLNGNTGKIMGASVKAKLTIAIQDYKLGHFLNDGKDYCGEVVVKDIGISVWEEETFCKFTKKELKKFFPLFKNNVNKGSFKKSCILGGSKKYPGSAILSLNALSAFKMGIGYSNLAIPNCLFDALSTLNPECTVNVCPDDGEFFLYNEDFLNKLLHFDCISVGMGMGVTEANYKILTYLLNNYCGRLIIDADGLNTLAKYGLDVLIDAKCEVALTPHIGEFCRLINANKNDVLGNEIELAKKFAQKYKVVLVLKNAVSVITDGQTTFINTSGCSGMAKAGSGDVLSGIMAGICTRDRDFVDCVSAACYLFGLAGESAEKKQNSYTMTASDIVREIATIISEIM